MTKLSRAALRKIIAESMDLMDLDYIDIDPAEIDPDESMEAEGERNRGTSMGAISLGNYGEEATAVMQGEEARLLSREIRRLSVDAGMSPMEYLVGLGFSRVGASNLLGIAGMFDEAEEGITFGE